MNTLSVLVIKNWKSTVTGTCVMISIISIAITATPNWQATLGFSPHAAAWTGVFFGVAAGLSKILSKDAA